MRCGEARVIDGTVLWEQNVESIAQSGLGRFLAWVAADRNLEVDGYASLWDLSVSVLEGFWESLWEYFDVE